MQRALIASTIVLAAALAFLLFQRLRPAPAAPPPAAAQEARPEGHAAASPTHAEAGAEAPPKPEAPAAAQAEAKPDAKSGAAAEAQAEPKPEARPDAEGVAEARPEPPADPEVKPAQAAAAPAAAPAGVPEPKVRRRRKPAALPDAAAAAIFADRPSPATPGGHGPLPRIPVLRAPPRGVAAPPHAALAAAARLARPARPSAPAASAAPAPGAPAAAAPLVPPAPPGPLTGAVAGAVLDAAGRPLARANVLAVAAAGDDAFEAVTDEDGTYLLPGMRAGRYLLLVPIVEGQRTSPPARAVEVLDGRVTRVELREPSAGATVRVLAMRPDGRPLQGQAVLVAGARPSPAGAAPFLGADAIYLPDRGSLDVLRGVPPGVYTLAILQGGDAPPLLAPQPVAVRSEAEQRLEIRFPAQAAAR